MSSGVWDHDDSEEEQEEQEEQEKQEKQTYLGGTHLLVPARGVNEEFCQMVQTIKWELYSGIILSPPLKTSTAQDNDLIKKYLLNLNQLYLFLEKATWNQIKEMMLGSFVMSMRHDILGCAKRIIEYGKANHFQSVDWIPYRDYLNISLRVHPFVHHKRMIGGQQDDVEDM